MPLVRVRIVSSDCDDCWTDLRIACVNAGFPHMGAMPAVPHSWLECACPHGKNGIKLEIVASSPPDTDDERDAYADTMMVEGPDGWLNLDATKNIGYSARETGKYGSHSTHDRFDGDSEP